MRLAAAPATEISLAAVADHEADQRQGQLVDRADDAVARSDQPAVLDQPRALGIVAVEVGLGEVVADPVGPQRQNQEDRGGDRHHRQRDARLEPGFAFRDRGITVERDRRPAWLARLGRRGDAAR